MKGDDRPHPDRVRSLAEHLYSSMCSECAQAADVMLALLDRIEQLEGGWK